LARAISARARSVFSTKRRSGSAIVVKESGRCRDGCTLVRIAT
jgi:hypothetical protein